MIESQGDKTRKKFDRNQMLTGMKESTGIKGSHKLLVYVDDLLMVGPKSSLQQEQNKIKEIFPGKVSDTKEKFDFLGVLERTPAEGIPSLPAKFGRSELKVCRSGVKLHEEVDFEV